MILTSILNFISHLTHCFVRACPSVFQVCPWQSYMYYVAAVVCVLKFFCYSPAIYHYNYYSVLAIYSPAIVQFKQSLLPYIYGVLYMCVLLVQTYCLYKELSILLYPFLVCHIISIMDVNVVALILSYSSFTTSQKLSLCLCVRVLVLF